MNEANPADSLCETWREEVHDDGTRHAVLVTIFTPSLTGEETESEPEERLDAQDLCSTMDDRQYETLTALREATDNLQGIW